MKKKKDLKHWAFCPYNHLTEMGLISTVQLSPSRGERNDEFKCKTHSALGQVGEHSGPPTRRLGISSQKILS